MKCARFIPFFAFITASFLSFSSSFATIVTVVDSGADIEHKALANHLWKNLQELDAKESGGDEDGNGLIDDLYGYNFVQMNNQLINKDDFALFDKDLQTMYKLQYFYELYRLGHNLFTKDLAELFNSHMSNEDLMKRGQLFGGFAHGTHVAGIIAEKNPKLELITIKGLGGGTQSAMHVLTELVENNNQEVTEAQQSVDEEKITNLLDDQSFNEQMVGFANDVAVSLVASVSNALVYSSQKNARVINASLGASLENIAPGIAATFAQYGATESDILTISKMILDAAIVLTEKRLKEYSPNALMVIAAGNSSADNDRELFTPANVNVDNAITVAATFDRHALASFSNYGATKVHVAAPGVGIYSSVPGGQYIHMNGTSQAAPYVTRIASKMLDSNTNLTPAQLKAILMGTVDKKDFLKGKVVSEGIVNEERAIMAADYANTLSIEESIKLASAIVLDVEALAINSIKSVGDKTVKLKQMKNTAVALPSL